MQLKPLTINDLPLFNHFYRLSGYEGFNTNVITMLMWNHEYHVHFYANDHYLVSLCQYNHLLFWNMPLTTKEYYQEAIDFMLAYSKEKGIPCFIDGVLNEPCEWIETLYPNHFKMVKERFAYDYIYERLPLQNLAGKKMQKRRNQFNNFIKHFDGKYTYQPLDKDDLQEVLSLVDYWSIQKEDQASIEIEKKGIEFLLKHLDDLPIKTGCLRIDGRMVAFIIGSLLNHETIQIHVEKGDIAYSGVYVAILKLFLEHEYPEALWINREDDMGLAYLRESKLRLHPQRLIEKSFLYLNKAIYRPSRSEDYNSLVQAWETYFKEDSQDFIKSYFQKYYQEENTWVCEIDHFIVSIAHFRPVMINNHGKEIKAYYIEGVSTHQMFRHQGYMRQLLKEAMTKINADIFLLQAYDWAIYDCFDFTQYTSKVKVRLNTAFKCEYKQLQEEMNCQTCYNLYKSYTQSKNGYALRDLEYYQNKKEMMMIENQSCLMTEHAYVIYQIINEQCVVLEAIALNQTELYPLLNHLINENKQVIALLEKDLAHNLKGEVVLFLKAKGKNKEIPLGDIYFNEYY